jgi:hypothetical protein
MSPFLNGDAKVGICFIPTKEIAKNFSFRQDISSKKRSRTLPGPNILIIKWMNYSLALPFTLAITSSAMLFGAGL